MLESKGVTRNRVQANRIGTDASGNLIGGPGVGLGNIIAGNGGVGVLIDSGTGNSIRQNSIFDNAGLGIGLTTANNANNNQPAPILTSATFDGQGHWVITGTLDARPNTDYFIEIFANAAPDPSGFGEGQTYLPSTPVRVTTDATGHAAFAVTVSGSGSLNNFSATATNDPTGDTSQFSNTLSH